MTADTTRLTVYAPGPVKGSSPTAISYDSSTLPLETLVERESIRSDAGTNERLAAEAGQHFLRLLAFNNLEAYCQPYIEAYAFDSPAERETLDTETLRFLDLIAGRVPDGDLLYRGLTESLKTTGSLPPNPAIASENRDDVLSVVNTWLDWYRALLSDAGQTGAAWDSEHMEYKFAVSAMGADKNEIVLAAPEYVEGSLDWYSFVHRADAKLGAIGSSVQIKRSMMPAPLSFRGRPKRRWWEFENSQTDFGSVKAAPEDLSRLMLVEFALIYGNDWFILPFDLDVGSLARITRLEIIDTFGSTTTISPYTVVDGTDSSWRMFCLSPGTKAPDMFFLPPVLGTSLQGATLEEVLFLRDEMANLAWAVERVVESPAGLPLDRFTAYQEKQRQQAAGASEMPAFNSGPPTYLLATSVPDYWFPLLPQRVNNSSSDPLIFLKRGQVETGDALTQPQGRILKPGEDLLLCEEEVPREGARVTRAYQYARWTNGSTHLWIGRRKRPGRGEASSGLRFDSVE
jgi:hypothetical protein